MYVQKSGTVLAQQELFIYMIVITTSLDNGASSKAKFQVHKTVQVS